MWHITDCKCVLTSGDLVCLRIIKSLPRFTHIVKFSARASISAFKPWWLFINSSTPDTSLKRKNYSHNDESYGVAHHFDMNKITLKKTHLINIMQFICTRPFYLLAWLITETDLWFWKVRRTNMVDYWTMNTKNYPHRWDDIRWFASLNKFIFKVDSNRGGCSRTVQLKHTKQLLQHVGSIHVHYKFTRKVK